MGPLEIAIILVVLAVALWPWLQRRSQARQRQGARRRKPYAKPRAREIDYEEED